MSQKYNLSDDFTHKKAVSNRNGVVGNNGRNIPMIPNIKVIPPNIFITKFMHTKVQ